MLPAKTQAEILRLHFSEHLRFRVIAKQLRVNRKSVAAVVRRRQVITERRQGKRRASILGSYHPLIAKLLDEAPGRSAVNILQRLRQAGYQGGITILRDHLRALRPPAPREAFFELDFAPGEAAQVDWGELGDVFGDGTKVHVFVMVLCWSRMLYLEFTLRENLTALLRCFERALGFFGGLCREYWLDNMPTAVAERLGRLYRLTPGFEAYRGFHGFKAVPCGLGKPQHKGRVEDGVKLVRHQFWPGRHFRDLADLNQQGREWRDGFANRREHKATGRVPELQLEAERPALLPLRGEPYDTDEILSARVTPFFRVHFDHNSYSVPWTLNGRTVTVRANEEQVRVAYLKTPVAHHRRSYLKGQDIKNPAHEQGLREYKAGSSRTWEVETVRSFGPSLSRYLELIQAGRRSLRAELRELLVLATVYGSDKLEQVTAILLQQGMVGASHLERALRLGQDQPKAPPPLQLTEDRLHFVPPNPDLASYDALLLASRRQGRDTEDESP